MSTDFCGICKAGISPGSNGATEGRCKNHRSSVPALWGIRHPDGRIQQKFKHMEGPSDKIRLVVGACAWPSKAEAKKHKQNRSDKIVRVRIVDDDDAGYIFNPVTGKRYPVKRTVRG